MLNGTLCFFIITVPLHHQEQAELSNSRGWQRSVLLRLQLGSHSGGSTFSFYECYYAYRKEQDVNSGMNDELPSVLFCIYIQFQYKMWLCVHYLPPVYYITYESEQCVWQRMRPWVEGMRFLTLCLKILTAHEPQLAGLIISSHRSSLFSFPHNNQHNSGKHVQFL